MSADESVLVVPTSHFHSLGLFHGFTSDVDRYLPALLDPSRLQFLPRAVAETDPSFKQLIPYVVLRSAGQIFHYTRGSGGSENRLHARRSIGIGGHISSEDGKVGKDAYRLGMLREVEEEVYLSTTYRNRLIGLINDDRTPVGEVHLGIVHFFDLDEPNVRYREAAISESGLASLSQLQAEREQFETWSQFLFDVLDRVRLD